MPMSLYGDLPDPGKSSSNPDQAKGHDSPGTSFSSLYSSLPAPGTNPPPQQSSPSPRLPPFSSSPSSSTATATTNAGPSAAQPSVQKKDASPAAPAPPSSASAGWGSASHFRPVRRRPVIQAKPKLRPVIPAGATIVSTTTVNKQQQVQQQQQEQQQQQLQQRKDEPEEPTLQIPKAPVMPRAFAGSASSHLPFHSTSDDVNGFQQFKKKKGKKGKKKDAQQPVVFDMNEDYDPHRPNDYQQYKEELKVQREEQKRKRKEEERRRYSRSPSPYSSASDRSPSPPRNRGRAYAPPTDYYETSSRRHRRDSRSPPRRRRASPSMSPSPPPVRRRPSPPMRPEPQSSRMDLEETAEDAYMRRVRLSERGRLPQQPEPAQPAQPAQPRSEYDDDTMPMGLGFGADLRGADERQRAPPAFVQAKTMEPPRRQPTPPPPSTVVLLTNMVGPGEVDDMLQTETADECSNYGKVERCLIYEIPHGAEDTAVRIFVKFFEKAAAQRAIQHLNGRLFGGRKVVARYFDDERFDRLDLAPGPDE
ncbi:hypothetical protein BCR43DRAFT_486379 [Syncephalastrum racemosum]|uniref:RRM domain-containing protein n=1 Tax=Syncephalastrum racemosum TaxID=13706 RepID=A0A1X2HP17_SYNRA|nr:hypothetical protein BCR43DRAFT_486379 [Syncephalastrum racemosum]